MDINGQFTLWHLGMDQYLLIPFLGGWTSIYQLFWCSPGVQGFDTLPFDYHSFAEVAPLKSNTESGHQNGQTWKSPTVSVLAWPRGSGGVLSPGWRRICWSTWWGQPHGDKLARCGWELGKLLCDIRHIMAFLNTKLIGLSWFIMCYLYYMSLYPQYIQ